MSRTSAVSPDTFTTFGDLLKHLRRRAGLTQRELSIAAGYSDAQISRLEKNERVPDAATLTARFVPALHLDREPEWVTRLLELAVEARRNDAPTAGISAPPVSPHNLPIQLTSFIGREKEIAEVKWLLSHSPLVTLTGAGGSGKTRLALQVAKGLLAEYSDGVWLIELAPLTDPVLVLPTVAATQDLREVPDRPLAKTLADHLHPKSLLLILDNCEHVIQACAELAEALLRTCPNLKLLATSREALNIAGETTLSVPPLTLPEPQPWRDPSSGQSALRMYEQSEAVRLFVARAAAASPDFMLTVENGAWVADICRHLDGIPLAIELAAARVRALSVQQIAQRLDNRFSLLTGGSRTALPRHQTLTALLDWSYDLLSDSERAVMRRLAVFRGGSIVEAAEAVCSGEGVETSEVLNVLTHLVDKSLVVADEQKDVMRYRLLETIREYAMRRLIDSGEAEDVRRRHAIFTLALVEAAASKIYGAEMIVWLERLAVEDDNLLAALDWAMKGAPDIRLRLVEVLRSLPFLSCDVYLVEGREQLGRALELTVAVGPVETRARVLYRAGRIAWAQGDYASARSLFEESTPLFRQVGNKGDLAFSLILLGRVTELVEGSHAAARSFFEESIAMMQEADDKWRWAVSLSFLGASVAAQGDDESARSILEQSVALYQDSGSNLNLGMPLGTLGYLALRRCDYAAARSLFRESLIVRQGSHEWGIMWILEGFAELAALEKEPERAAQLYGAAQALLDSVGECLDPIDRLGYDQYVATVREQLGETAFAQAWAEGRAMTLEQAIAYALKEN